MVYQKRVLSGWPYPFLDDFTVIHHIIFILLCVALGWAFCFLAKFLTNLRTKLLTSDGKFLCSLQPGDFRGEVIVF